MRCMQSERRWACTGTPINTDLRDLRGQLGGLHAAPFLEAGFANQFLKGGLGVYRREVLFLLRRLMIRHSKGGVQAQGEWHLPAKTEVLVPVHLTDSEWRLYERTHDRVRAEFERYAQGGVGWCQKNMMAIMALLTPLRRLCSGLACSEARVAEPSQATEGEDSCDDAPAAAGKPFHPGQDDAECSVCMEAFEQPVRTPCGHWFCHECIGQVLHAQGLCPMCRAAVAPGDLQPARYPAALQRATSSIPGEAAAHLESKVKVSRLRLLKSRCMVSKWVSHSRSGHVLYGDWSVISVLSRLQVLIKELQDMHTADPSNKALIFTQYKESVTILARRLANVGFSHRTISGGMPMKQRAAAIEAFQHDGGTTVSSSKDQ